MITITITGSQGSGKTELADEIGAYLRGTSRRVVVLDDVASSEAFVRSLNPDVIIKTEQVR